MVNYEVLCEELKALTADVPHTVANLANAAALLFGALDRVNWAGFYLMKNGRLVLGPFQGKPACIEIAVGRGVCGTAVAENRTVLVEDVHAFPGHIACDAASRSEIVIPLRKGETIVGVLDIDSPVTGRFDERDRAGLEAFAHLLEHVIFEETARRE